MIAVHATRPHPLVGWGLVAYGSIGSDLWRVGERSGLDRAFTAHGRTGLGHLLEVLGDPVEVDVVGRTFGGALLGIGGRSIGTRCGEGLVVGAGRGVVWSVMGAPVPAGVIGETTPGLTGSGPGRDERVAVEDGHPFVGGESGACCASAVAQWLRLIERPLAARYTSRAMIAPMTEPMMPDGCSAPSVPSSRKIR